MSPAEALVILSAVVAGSMVKAVTGMGLPLVAVPFMSLVVPVETAVVVIAFPNVMANLTLAVRERDAWGDTRDLPVIIATSVVGAVAGTWLLVNLSERVLVLSLAAVVAAYVVSRVRNPELAVSPERGRRLAPVVGTATGVAQGAVGVSGPIIGAWFHAYRLRREAYVLSVTLVFLLSGTTQMVLMAGSGLYDDERVLASLAALIPALGLIPFGTRLRNRLSSATFDLVVLVMLAASAVALVLRGVL